MGTTFDAPSSTSVSSTDTSTHSHTCTGADRALIVGVSAIVSGGATISTVTYNGVGLTFIGAATVGGGPNSRAEMWRLIAPATGAHDIVVTWSASIPSFVTGACSFTDVDQTTPVENFTSDSGDVDDLSINVSSNVGDMVMDTIATGADPTVGAGQTQRWNLNPGDYGAGSTEAGAASVAMGWTYAGPTETILLGVSVKQKVAAGNAMPMAMDHYRRRWSRGEWYKAERHGRVFGARRVTPFDHLYGGRRAPAVSRRKRRNENGVARCDRRAA